MMSVSGLGISQASILQVTVEASHAADVFQQTIAPLLTVPLA